MTEDFREVQVCSGMLCVEETMPGLAQASGVKEDDSPVVEAEGAAIGKFSGFSPGRAVGVQV